MFEAVDAATSEELALLAGVLLRDGELARLGEDEDEDEVGRFEAVVAATQRVINAVSAIQDAAVARLADAVDDRIEREVADRVAAGVRAATIPSSEQYAAAMLAPLLRCSTRTMVTRVHRARVLTTMLPATSAMARRGDLEPYRTSAVVKAAGTVGWDQITEFEARLHDIDITDLPTSRLAERARRCAARVDPDGAAAAAASAAGRRYVRVAPGGEPGMTTWKANLPSAVSEQLWAAVTALGDEYLRADPALTADQARADALTDLALTNAHITTTVTLSVPVNTKVDPEATSTGQPPPGRGPGPVWPLLVAVPVIATRLDLAPPGRPPAPLTSGRPSPPLLTPTGELEEHLAWLVDLAVELDAEPHVRRNQTLRTWFVPGGIERPGVGTLLPPHLATLLADPDTRIRVSTHDRDTGFALVRAELTAPSAANTAHPDTAYRPGAALARTVRARDQHCRFPGCSTPARHCDLDHVIPHPDGPTSAANLQTLCRTHHGFKHHARWAVTMTEDGICTWTSSTGRTYTTTPHVLRDRAA